MQAKSILTKKALTAKDSNHLGGKYELAENIISIMKSGSEVKVDGFMLVGSCKGVRAKKWTEKPGKPSYLS